MKDNNILVRFFNESHFWGAKLQEWQKSQVERVQWLKGQVETRWYTAASCAKSIISME